MVDSGKDQDQVSSLPAAGRFKIKVEYQGQ